MPSASCISWSTIVFALIAPGCQFQIEETNNVAENRNAYSGNAVWLRDRFPPVSEADIDSFQEEFMIELPRDYRSFLLANNGGTFHDTVVSTLDDTVTSFYALKTEYVSKRLGRRDKQHLNESKLLTIANTLRGDPVCISVDPESRGQVFVYDSIDLGGLSEPEWHKLADSFSQFYTSLRTDFEKMENCEETKGEPFLAILENDHHALNQLLINGLLPDCKDSNGKTLLIYAVTHSRLELMKLLLDKGANIEATDRKGQTALFYAAGGGAFDAFLLLVEHRANIEARDKSGKSVLIWSIRTGAYRVASELISLGADVNYRTPDGRTALNSCENLTVKYVRPKLLTAGAKE